MSRLLRIVILGAAVLGLSACVTTTTFDSTWKAPDAQPVSPVGKSIAAVFVSRDESRRRAGEDALAADLTKRGAHGIAAYTLLPNDQRENVEAARERLKAAGASGVVVMRVIGKDQKVTYTPGYASTFPVYYAGFGPYWSYGWRTVYEPGYLQSDTVVSVETLVYSLIQDKLLWAGTSRTTNPANLDSLVNEVADAVAKEMSKQGLLAP
jgi:hypothetical protein